MIPCPQYEIWQYCPAWKQISKEERDKVLDDYCIIDLTYYVWGEAESDDVRLCQGKGCNYCGRYNELRQQVNHEPT